MGWFNHKDRAKDGTDFAQGNQPFISHKDTEQERNMKMAYYATGPEHYAFTPRKFDDGYGLVPVDLHEDKDGKYHPRPIY